MKTIALLFCFLSLFINSIAQSAKEITEIPKKSAGFYYVPQDTTRSLIKIDLSLVVANQAGGGVHNGTGSGQKVYERSIPGKTSNIQIYDQQPTFYFYFENNLNLTADNWLFSVVNSPSAFIILKTRSKRDRRDFSTGIDIHIGGWGSAKSGVSKRDIIDFECKTINDNVYEITFKAPLEFGEYCCIFTGSAPSKFVNNKVLDFSICENE